MANRLANENSPYLLQHKDNPVDWYPWSAEALKRAREDDKPIFLSIGYAACHWCHVMEHESFENAETAALMNAHFVNIKVDREQRPDIDSIYMKAVVSMTGQGGWPLSVFLTPDGKPFYGGTYFPPVRRYNMPSFKEVLLSLAGAWETKREEILQTGDQLVNHIQQEVLGFSSKVELRNEALDQAAMKIAQAYDWKHGGWGNAPKFPQAMTIEFLLQRASLGDKMALEIANHALWAMAMGGLYDVIGGGFARYSVDDYWLVPHFEKMLYDNALLARVYLHAYMLTGDSNYRRICDETLEFASREMTHNDGGFYSSLDADSEGEEGKYYLWTQDELKKVLRDPDDFEFFCTAYDITSEGNFEGKNVLQRAIEDDELAKRFAMGASEVATRLKGLHGILLHTRAGRIKPDTDDKVLPAWNGLMLIAYAEAARYLGNAEYKDIAVRNAHFLLESLYVNGRLLRSWRRGKAAHNAFLEDYASLILGLLSLYQTDPNPHWFTNALQLAEEMMTQFRDPQGGFFDTRDDHEDLIVRPKELQDNATPSGNSLAATALLQLASYTGNSEWHDFAAAMLRSIQGVSERYPTAFAQWLYATNYALAETSEIAIVGAGEDEAAQALVNEVWRKWRPFSIFARADFPPPEGSPALLLDRPLKDGLATAYVCQHFVCKAPVNTPKKLAAQLG